ncbi:histone deacetylase [uncultured Abyssibacter sp.]|uniref:histone deacetylase family protein n=1 Tax=uncultured Abyssibacter sp. TaxID=2320202 RepID=UPI0032B24015
MSRLPIVFHPVYSKVVLPDRHPFPMSKFGMLREELLAQGIAVADQFSEPEPADVELLSLAHDRDYLRRLIHGDLSAAEVRRQGFPWSPALVARSMAAVGGTCHTLELALSAGLAAHCAGGTHHAHRDFGSGYCVLNDLAVAAAWALASGRVGRVLIIDCDVHQGDGTARIFEREPRVFTLSFHAATNFPVRKAVSDRDVALARDTGDAGYLAALAEHIPEVMDRFRPDCVLYDAGADVHVADRLGHLALTDDGMRARDRYVIEQCLRRDVPVACVIGGGYDRDVPALVRRHVFVHEQASKCFDQWLN